MEKSCKNIEDLLVDYVDGQLPLSESNKVAKHLAKCQKCQKLLDTMKKSLDLTGVIWADSLSETENICIPAAKTRKTHWPRYATIAASILVVAATSVVWHTLTRPEVNEITFAEIERKITESGNAARLLAAAELLSDNPKAQTFVKQQYKHIIEAYPETTAATKAKLRIK